MIWARTLRRADSRCVRLLMLRNRLKARRRLMVAWHTLV